ncbi:MAG: hypothetical protein JSU63_14275 [Phycisphaerales bacterium]|nr:MAG: hypothetical protein JSU63_14275 [Phycisphaerales bacterium]
MNRKGPYIVPTRARILYIVVSAVFVQGAMTVNAQVSCWEPVDPTDPQPGATSHHAMVYDSHRDVAVLFGGLIVDSYDAYNETWEWNCATRTWVQRTPDTSPPPRYAHAMAYDSARNVVVLFGGGSSPALPGNELNDTWEYDGTTWVQRSPCGGVVPGKRFAHAMVFDSCRGVTVLFGGHDAGNRLNDTWEWDGTCWTERAQTGPAQREYPAMAFVGDCCKTIMFGGQDASQQFGDTWAWDGANWTNVSPTTGPSPRYGSGMSHDSFCKTFVLFGGASSVGGHFDETWEFGWDCAAGAWTQRQCQLAPAARIHTGMVFDETCNKTFLFGGLVGADRTDDAWLYPREFCFPAISLWGVIILALSGLTAATLVLQRKRYTIT